MDHVQALEKGPTWLIFCELNNKVHLRFIHFQRSSLSELKVIWYKRRGFCYTREVSIHPISDSWERMRKRARERDEKVSLLWRLWNQAWNPILEIELLFCFVMHWGDLYQVDSSHHQTLTISTLTFTLFLIKGNWERDAATRKVYKWDPFIWKPIHTYM